MADIPKDPTHPKTRKYVYGKYGGRCAYCGEEISYKELVIDHFEPKNRGMKSTRNKRINDVSNLMPSCNTCNALKANLTIEQFREQIKGKVEYSFVNWPSFKVLVKYGLININPGVEIVFHYEKNQPEHGGF